MLTCRRGKNTGGNHGNIWILSGGSVSYITGAFSAEWIVNVCVTDAFLTVTRRNVCCENEKGQLSETTPYLLNYLLHYAVFTYVI